MLPSRSISNLRETAPYSRPIAYSQFTSPARQLDTDPETAVFWRASVAVPIPLTPDKTAVASVILERVFILFSPLAFRSSNATPSPGGTTRGNLRDSSTTMDQETMQHRTSAFGPIPVPRKAHQHVRGAATATSFWILSKCRLSKRNAVSEPSAATTQPPTSLAASRTPQTQSSP